MIIIEQKKIFTIMTQSINSKETLIINGIYEVEAGDYVEVFKLIFGTKGELRMKGGTLLLSYIVAGDEFKISGHGEIKVLGSVECGEKYSVRFCF